LRNGNKELAMVANNNAPSEILADDLLWGAGEIAVFLGLPIRRVYYLIEQEKIPVRKFNEMAAPIEAKHDALQLGKYQAGDGNSLGRVRPLPA
jgi:hypothetical protein